jgi:hypothetical protein
MALRRPLVWMPYLKKNLNPKLWRYLSAFLIKRNLTAVTLLDDEELVEMLLTFETARVLNSKIVKESLEH